MSDDKSVLIDSHKPCPDCGSSDALSIYTDHTFCFVCSKHTRLEDTYNDRNNAVSDSFNTSSIKSSNIKSIKEIPETGFKPYRGISTETMKKYGIWTQGNDQYYPYYKDDVHSANKIRTLASKGFLVQGDLSRSKLFGQQLFPSGGKTITICEGELDAVSTFEMFGSKYPAVSVKSASSAEKDVTDNWEYVNSFEQIVICFDKDEPHRKPNGDVWHPGQEAAQKVAALFPLGKVRILTLSEAKDANDYIQKGWGSKFVAEWWRAPVWTPVEIKLAKNMWAEVSATKNCETQPYPWESLNRFTYGLRLSELVTITAQTGIGKTSIIKAIEWELLKNTEYGIGVLHLEEPNGDTLLGLMSITANKPLHLPDVRAEVKDEELRRYYDETCNTERIVVWNHFGSNEIEGVLNTVRHMVALGCKYIFIDHLSIIVSDQSGDERKQLDEISTKLKTLCMELNIAVICVIHQNRQGEIRGTAGVEQLSNMVFKLHREKEDPNEWRRNITKIVVQKNRFCGTTGPACYLFYNSETGRLEELTKDQIKLYESGMADNTEDFSNWKAKEEHIEVTVS